MTVAINVKKHIFSGRRTHQFCHEALLFYVIVVFHCFLRVSSKSCNLWTEYYSIPAEDSIEDHILVDHVIMVIDVTSPLECLSWCAAVCSCRSFNVQTPESVQTSQLLECQLNREDNETFRDSLIPYNGFTYYNMRAILRGMNPWCKKYNCRNNCCLSRPCVHASSCTETCGNTKHKYKCHCKKGHIGNNCQFKAPSSCQHYFRENSRASSGITKIQDGNRDIFPAFCYKEEKSGIVWNLLSSFSLKNGELFRKPLFTDSPVNELDPVDWSAYRMSYHRMMDLFGKSTFWKFTCNFEKTKSHLDVDFAMGKTSVLNILSFRGEKCQKIDLVNIRGYSCTNCTAYAFQGYGQYSGKPVGYSFSLLTNLDLCEFRSYSHTTGYEMNFGNYQWYNPQFSCASSNQSTTQLWVGG